MFAPLPRQRERIAGSLLPAGELSSQAAEALPGESLAPQLGGAVRPDNHVFLEWTGDPKDSGAGPSGRTVISPDGMKLVLYDTDQSLLFDRRRDPLEMNNLYGKADHRRLRAKLAGWQKRTGDTFALF